jgi:DNA-binding NarL/FixJ family response regulator
VNEEKIKILVVDDNEEDLQNMLTVLEREGYEVDGARNGELAFEKLNQEDYQLVITDLRMPKQDGLALLNSIRKDFPKTGVMVITGYPSLDTSIQSLRGEAFDYIVKPFDVEYLKHRIANFLEAMKAAGELDPDKVQETFSLTAREVEVVQQLYRGLTNAQIATNLQISEGTVKIHLEHIFRKAGVKNRTALLTKLREL